jgi:hypothetical protein
MRKMLFAILVAMAVACASVSAQTLPAGPAEFAGGTLAVSGEASISIGAPDEIAFFNYTDYEHNALRMVRVSLSGTWRPSERFAFLTQFRSEDGERVIPYAWYARIRPLKAHAFDIQFGRIPPVFGAFARRTYGGSDNPLVGYPLAYQYLTSLRSKAIPGNADDLLIMRARGWRVSYPVGDQTPDAGVPIISAYRWDTGGEAHWATGPFDFAGAVTTGTLSSPKVRDDNNRPAISGRAAWKPVMGLVLGVSASRGEFLDRSIEDRYAPVLGRHSYTQTVKGFDAEYSRGYWIVRGEVIDSEWVLPALGVPLITKPLGARSGYVEGRYRFTPRLFAAARADTLTFSDVTGAKLFGGQPTPWDAPVKRVEMGGGIYIQRNLTLRTVVQRNWRPAGRVHNRTFVSGQLSYWF